MAATSPITFPPLPATPSGSARAGDTAGFRDLKTGLDANFNLFKTRATSVDVNEMHSIVVPSNQVLTFATPGTLFYCHCYRWGPWRMISWSFAPPSLATNSAGMLSTPYTIARIISIEWMMPAQYEWMSLVVGTTQYGSGGIAFSMQVQPDPTPPQYQQLQILCGSAANISYPSNPRIDFTRIYLHSGQAPVGP